MKYENPLNIFQNQATAIHRKTPTSTNMPITLRAIQCLISTHTHTEPLTGDVTLREKHLINTWSDKTSSPLGTTYLKPQIHLDKYQKYHFSLSDLQW